MKKLLAPALVLLCSCSGTGGGTQAANPSEHAWKAVQRMWDALQGSDYEEFKRSIWPAQIRTAGETGVTRMFDHDKKYADRSERIEFASCEAQAIKPAVSSADPDVTAVFNVKVTIVSKTGKGNGSSFQVVRNGAGYFVHWVR